MKKNLLCPLLLMLFTMGLSLNLHAQKHAKKKADEATEAWRYEIEVAGVGVEGYYLIKVWSYSKRPAVAIEQAKKNAVHAIIFKGFAGKAGISGKPPLTSNPNIENEKQEFFADFFQDGGKYMKFVTLTTDGAIAAEDRVKVGKVYKIGVLVSVNVDLLKKDLQSAGILKSLSAGF